MSTPAPLTPTIYIGTFIHTLTPDKLTIHSHRALGVDATGTIAFIDDSLTPDEPVSAIATRNGWASLPYRTVNTTSSTRTTFFFPGFIDTHTHAPQYPNNGIFGRSTLLDWLNTYTFPLESSFASLPRAHTVYTRVIARALAHGTTTAAYHATVHVPATNLLLDLCLAAGQRALVGRVCMDRLTPSHYQDPSPAAALAATEACIAHALAADPAGTLVRPVITPRFAPTCTAETLTLLGDLHSRTGVFAQTHISENVDEIALVASLFPAAPHYTGVYDSFRLLTRRMILAHAVHLSDAEVALVAARGAGVSHCPTSNVCLTSGRCPVRKLMDAGVAVGLGTDMSGGFSPSILAVAREALGLSRHIAMGLPEGEEKERTKLAVSDALWLATRGGARVVELEEKVGAFEVGMEWDAQMITMDDVPEHGALAGGDMAAENVTNIGPVDVFSWQEDWEDRVAKWLYMGDDRNVSAVWVKGRLVHSRKSPYTD